MTAYAAFFKESCMKGAEANKLQEIRVVAMISALR
jgi:hypothetical protein